MCLQANNDDNKQLFTEVEVNIHHIHQHWGE